MVSNAWRQDSKGWVWLGSDGAMVTNAWVQDSNGWCYIGANGYVVYKNKSLNKKAKLIRAWLFLI